MKYEPAILTIGYEGRSSRDVIDRIAISNVDLLVDVRYRPQSRKPGLSKTALSRNCLVAGVRYTHIRELGTPPHLMKLVRAERGYTDEINEDFRIWITREARALDATAAMVQQIRCCLLCFEADHLECHRTVVADELGSLCGSPVIHL